jgi:hypothetical protein
MPGMPGLGGDAAGDEDDGEFASNHTHHHGSPGPDLPCQTPCGLRTLGTHSPMGRWPTCTVAVACACLCLCVVHATCADVPDLVDNFDAAEAKA